MSETRRQMNLFEQEAEDEKDESVECLGLVFANDNDRRR